jgi:peptidoglycan hydrolase-like protein with peptidoglycan-binding domain
MTNGTKTLRKSCVSISSTFLITCLLLHFPSFLAFDLAFTLETSSKSKQTAAPSAKKTGSSGPKKSSSSKQSQGAKHSLTKNKKKVKGSKAVRSTHSKKGMVRGQLEIEPPRVIEIQTALATAGYYKDEPSGKWDQPTIQAMSAYQEANGFKVTGKPDALSLKKLGL